MTARGFTIRADAFPIDPAPGNNASTLGVRPAAVRLSIANAPATAYGRAAAADLGFAEQYTGPPPPGTAAECDTASSNIPDEATAAPGGTALAARCDRTPSSRVSAAARDVASGGVRAGAVAATASASGGGRALVAAAASTVSDGEIGPLRFALARFVGSVRANGRRGGAAAIGRVEVLGATVSGIPVTIGPEGVAVDETRVPLDLVAQANEVVKGLFGEEGYIRVTLLQPRAGIAEDGSRAEVSGGGLFVYMTNNDPSATYYLGVTVVGGSISAFTGPPIPDSSAAELVSPSAPFPAPAFVQGETIARPVEATQPAAQPPALFAGRASVALPHTWSGWPFLAAAAGVLALGGIAARRRVGAWWDAVADRYLRG